MRQRINRSALETLFECEHRRYYEYELDGTGVVPVKGMSDTDIGLALHDALHQTLLTEGTYQYRDLPQFGKEDNTLLAGLVLTFKRHIMPVLLEEYEILSMEQEWSVPLGEFDLSMRMDVIARHKASGQLEIFDWKTKKALGWIRDTSYSFNLQTALYTWAVEQKTEEPCRGMTYVIFEKGDVKFDKSKTFDHKIRQSPYCYGYKSEHGAYQAKWSKGWQKFPTWTEVEIDTWVHKVMDAADRQATYQILPNLTLDPTVRETMIANALRREEIFKQCTASKSPGLLFRNHQACYKYGEEYACPYIGLCWYNKPTTPEQFTERIPHHED